MPKLTAVTILAPAVVALGAIAIYDQVRIADLKEALMSVMFEERRSFEFTDNYLDEGQFLEVTWSDKSFETFHNEFEQLQQKVSGRAAGIL